MDPRISFPITNNEDSSSSTPHPFSISNFPINSSFSHPPPLFFSTNIPFNCLKPNENDYLNTSSLFSYSSEKIPNLVFNKEHLETTPKHFPPLISSPPLSSSNSFVLNSPHLFSQSNFFPFPTNKSTKKKSDSFFFPPLAPSSSCLSPSNQLIFNQSENLLNILKIFKSQFSQSNNIIKSFKKSKSLLFKKIFNELYSQFLEQKSCDLVLRTPKDLIMTHQIVLGGSSPTLNHFLQSKNQHLSQPLLIWIRDVPIESVAEVLKFLYTSVITLTSSNVVSFIQISFDLHLPLLTNICNDYLVQDITLENSFLYLSIATNYKLSSSFEIFGFIASNFKSFSCHDHLPLLPIEYFQVLLSHPLNNSPPLILFKSIVSWISYDKINRLPLSKNLISLVDIFSIPPEELAEVLEKTNWLFEGEAFKTELFNAFKFHATNKENLKP